MTGSNFIFSIVLLVSSGWAGALAASEPDPVAYYTASQEVEALIEDENYEAAYDRIQSLTEAWPEDPEKWWLQARLAETVGDWQGTISAFEHALALGTRHPSYAASRIAIAHARLGETESALDWLENSVALGFPELGQLAAHEAFAEYTDNRRFKLALGIPLQEPAGRVEGWKSDIDFLVAEAQRLHADPENPAHAPSFVAAAEDIKTAIPEMTDTEVMNAIRRLIAQGLHDGHSYLGRPGDDTKLGLETRNLPVLFHYFDGDIAIINAAEGWDHLLGAKVLRIGDENIASFLDRLSGFTHADNSHTMRFIGVTFLMRAASVLQAMQLGDADSISMEFKSPDGERFTEEIPYGHTDFPRKLRVLPGQADVPLFLSNVDDNYWSTELPDMNSQYLQINQIRNKPDGPALGEFADMIVTRALQDQRTNLIVDLRLNNGGNNSFCIPLVRALVRYETARDNNRIFIMTRHNTFSAAQNCINQAERFTNAIFMGEISGSSPNFTGEENTIILPFSKLMVSISDRYWQDSDSTDHRPWIAPDIPVPLTYEDYIRGNDPALQAITRLTAEDR